MAPPLVDGANLWHMVQAEASERTLHATLSAAYQQAGIFELEADIISIHTALLLDDYGI